jgi:predicted outer membrane repeat protein
MKGVLRNFVLVIGFVVASASHATHIYKVGGDAACTHSTIQAAIDAAAASAGEDYVWMASNQSYSGQHVSIHDQTVDVVGGFANCSATQAGTALTTVSGLGNGKRAVFSIGGTSQVFMGNLWIRDADRRGNTAIGGDGAGGGIDFDGSGSLKLAQMTVSLNEADYGAGINFRGSGGNAELRIAHDTLILSNTAAVSGGGIRVEGSARLFVLEPQTLIAFNSVDGTDGKGGGIEQLAPARVDIGSPGYNGGAVVQFNDADYGGGIAVNTNNDSNVYARLFSTDPHNPVQIANNAARKTGGGIWVSPCSSVTSCYSWAYLCAQDFRINNNIAQEGAAIYADVDTDASGFSARSYVLLNRNSEFNLRCRDPEPVENLGAVACAAGVPCNELAYNVTENASGDPTNGAVILMQTDGHLNAIRFRMHHNVAAHLIRSVDDDEGNTTDLSRCLFTDNQLTASAILHTPDSGGSVVVDECTFARNSIASGAAVEVNHVDTTITRSIFDEPGVPVLSSPNWDHVAAIDVMAQDLSTLPFSTRDIQATPSFVDPDHGDYHLRPNSPGIDFTDSDHLVDLDSNPRKVNQAAENVFGIQDLGALETQLSCHVSDSIFCDGFDLE